MYRIYWSRGKNLISYPLALFYLPLKRKAQGAYAPSAYHQMCHLMNAITILVLCTPCHKSHILVGDSIVRGDLSLRVQFLPVGASACFLPFLPPPPVPPSTYTLYTFLPDHSLKLHIDFTFHSV